MKTQKAQGAEAEESLFEVEAINGLGKKYYFSVIAPNWKVAKQEIEREDHYQVLATNRIRAATAAEIAAKLV